MTITNVFSEEPYNAVSMTQLIATPERYKGKKIRVIGYYSGEGDVLYLSKEHAEISDNKSGIYISGPSLGKNVLRDSLCIGKYIEVTGKFRQTKDWAFYSIAGVKKAKAVKTGEWCWEMSEK